MPRETALDDRRVLPRHDEHAERHRAGWYWPAGQGATPCLGRGRRGAQLREERGDGRALLRAGAHDGEDPARQGRVERAQPHLRRRLVVGDLRMRAMPTPWATSAATTAKSLLKPTIRGSWPAAWQAWTTTS